MKHTQKDNLLIQSYFTTSFLLELHNQDFLNSDYYKSAKFEDKYVQKHLPSVGIDNQGTMLMILYTMLVIPKQLIGQDFPEEFKNLNQKVEEVKSHSSSTYRDDSDRIDYIRHIRNAVAHARVSFIPNKIVSFTDENNRGEHCIIEIPLNEFGQFLTELQKIFFTYIEKIKN